MYGRQRIKGFIISLIVSYDTIKDMKPPYEITPTILQYIVSISKHIGEVSALHLHKPPAQLRKSNRIKTIQSSLEIEGNTLSEEQITALLENKRVVAPQKDILEVQNAITVYDRLNELNPLSYKSLLTAHQMLMTGLVPAAGNIRSKSVGIITGSEVRHLAPPAEMVKPLLNDLFDYIKNDPDPLLLKSCVFHYEFEFIHPFTDGNGRMGRLWQTLILKQEYPVFEFLPVESIIRDRQKDYYRALSESDKQGKSTAFIEFMLAVLNDALEKSLSYYNITLTGKDRIEQFKAIIKNELFSRQVYLRNFKEISTATASRDLKEAVDRGILVKSGDKRMTLYKFDGA